MTSNSTKSPPSLMSVLWIMPCTFPSFHSFGSKWLAMYAGLGLTVREAPMARISAEHRLFLPILLFGVEVEESRPLEE